jgi:hypothetical protein
MLLLPFRAHIVRQSIRVHDIPWAVNLEGTLIYNITFFRPAPMSIAAALDVGPQGFAMKKLRLL